MYSLSLKCGESTYAILRTASLGNLQLQTYAFSLTSLIYACLILSQPSIKVLIFGVPFFSFQKDPLMSKY